MVISVLSGKVSMDITMLFKTNCLDTEWIWSVILFKKFKEG
jgi:sugar (pentulose or hexulose) kinase